MDLVVASCIATEAVVLHSLNKAPQLNGKQGTVAAAVDGATGVTSRDSAGALELRSMPSDLARQFGEELKGGESSRGLDHLCGAPERWLIR